MDTERAASLAQIDARVVADQASIAAEYERAVGGAAAPGRVPSRVAAVARG
jgi:hypothetical protein